jgi:deoxyribodipyrimidine photo-lyase
MMIGIEQANQLIDKNTTLFWFRRDLRIEDNASLYHALIQNDNILPIFIFDTVILKQLDDSRDRRVDFIYRSILSLKHQLEENGSSLLVFYGDPIEIFRRISPARVHANHDYEPYATERDAKVRTILEKKSVAFFSYKDQVIFEKNEVTKDNGEPYTIFTPYSRKWKARLNSFYQKSYPTTRYLKALKKTKPLPMPSLEDLGFRLSDGNFPERKITQSIITNYHKQRDHPSIHGTTRLSVHLRFGTISIRKLVQIAKKKNEAWLNELIWRDFYHMILWHFPHVVTRSFKPAYDHIRWRNNEKEFDAWCEGKTGYPIVDAGMRELNETGFMHNRVRMIVASFLTKHLLIDWRWGEGYFANKLLDYDLAANNGGWQWAAGSGCDAAPYFRVFNPELQAQRFDPNHNYIRKWVPEFESSVYPEPIVDHQFARDRFLKAYKAALNEHS